MRIVMGGCGRSDRETTVGSFSAAAMFGLMILGMVIGAAVALV